LNAASPCVPPRASAASAAALAESMLLDASLTAEEPLATVPLYVHGDSGTRSATTRPIFDDQRVGFVIRVALRTVRPFLVRKATLPAIAPTGTHAAAPRSVWLKSNVVANKQVTTTASRSPLNSSRTLSVDAWRNQFKTSRVHTPL